MSSSAFFSDAAANTVTCSCAISGCGVPTSVHTRPRKAKNRASMAVLLRRQKRQRGPKICSGPETPFRLAAAHPPGAAVLQASQDSPTGVQSRAGVREAMAEAARVEGDFDYIVVGAGSAGCVLANRLSADPTKRVLLLEAGGKDNWIWFHIPVGYLFAIGNPRADWLLKTEPEPGLNGRSLDYPRGKVVGGSSAINGMIYMLGQSGDYDHWRQLGLPGWSWDDVRPYF